MEKREKNGLSGLRIDVWETPAHPEENAGPRNIPTPIRGSASQYSHLRRNESSMVISPVKNISPAKEIQENLSEADEDLAPNATIPSYTDDVDGEQTRPKDDSCQSDENIELPISFVKNRVGTHRRGTKRIPRGGRKRRVSGSGAQVLKW